ncbi:Ryanodine receptor 2, partial [Xenoophorus captivus]
LVLTVGLLAVVVYLYTVVAFNFFRKFYNKSEDGELPDMKCDDMLTVSMTEVLSKTPRCMKVGQMCTGCFNFDENATDLQ